MPIGGSLALIALGAVLRFGVTAHVSGVSVGMVGLILLIVGAVGLLVSVGLLVGRRRTDIVYRQRGPAHAEPGLPDVSRY